MAALNELDSDNEFGYDFSLEDESALLQLGSNNSFPRTSPPTSNLSAVIDRVPTRAETITAIPKYGRLSHARSGNPEAVHTPSNPAVGPIATAQAFPSPVSLDEDVTYPDLSRALSILENEPSTAREVGAPEIATVTAAWDPFDDDGRSPLQRFRSYPRRPLTVTDLTAGSWCELQYWYTLTRLPGGRRRKTPAMRQGSRVHQALEDEVHTTVKVEIMTKEDGFGLKLWNFVQGLRTLRDTGLTRELEVWGMVDGNVVNGVIDSVSYDNPNPEFEEELSSQESQVNHQQSRLTDYFPPKRGETSGPKSPKIYIADVKTRGSLMPVTNAVLRPARYQLLLYHRFLADMAAGKLDFLKLFRRYGLDSDDTFSDAFIAQIGSLHDDIFVDAPSSSEPEPSSSGQGTDSTYNDGSDDELRDGSDFLKYKTLRELVLLVKQEIELAFPEGEDSLGHMLRIQYVHRDDGREIELHDFPVSKQALETYLSRYMAWWRGEREAHGVEIEEAFKCRTCDFAADCTWRLEMDKKRKDKAQQKMLARRTR